MKARMKAVVYERYGPPEVLRLQELEKPSPREGEILVRIRATTVTSGDHRLRSLDVPAGFGAVARLAMGVFGPRQRVLGSELAGDVEAVGPGVLGFRIGDAVLGYPDTGLGCHAEYRCMRERGTVVRMPAGLGYEEAASLPFGGLTALHFLRKGEVAAGEKVLVNGASGAVGSACVQLARHLGAEVTGVCGTANQELVRSLGAAHLVDYTREDFTRGGRRYDVIVDTAGTAPLSRCQGSLAPGGRLLLVLATARQTLLAPWDSLRSGKKVVAGVAFGSRDDLQLLASLAESGALRPVIDRRYALEQIAEAHRHVDSGHKRGSVVVTVG